MKLSSTFFLVVLLVFSAPAIADKPMGGDSPWVGAVTFCDSDDLSIRELRQTCIDFWYMYQGIEIVPPVVVTTCPPDHATDNATTKGRKPLFSPNGFCPLVCPEGEVEIVCSVMRWDEE